MRGREGALLAGTLLLFVFSSCLANRPPSIAFASGFVAVPPALVGYLPIVITNSESSPTPTPFQQMVQIDSSAWTAYEAPNLQNVEFFSADGTVIPSWLESGNSSASNATVYWLKLSQSIPAGSNITVYMGLASNTTNLFDGNLVGEAPQLSPSYGQYDNGRNVFAVYDNFGSSSLSPLWAVNMGSGSYLLQDGLTMNFNQSGSIATASTFGPGASFDTYVTNLWDIDNIGFFNLTQPTPPGVDSYQGAWIRTACGNTYPEQWNPQGDANSCGSPYGSLLPGQTGVPGIYSVSLLSNSSTIQYFNYGLGASNQPISSNMPVYPLSAGYAGGFPITVQWARVRATPPNGTMPTASVGGAETISFTEEGLPSGMAWSVSFNGKTISSTLSSLVVHANLLYGLYNWTAPTLSVGAGTRYAVNQSSGTLTVDSLQASIALHFNEQFEGFFSYSVVGGGIPSPPQLTWVSFGISSSVSLSQAPQSLWLDAGTSWSVTGQLPFVEGFGVASERFVTPNSIGDASPGANLTINFYHQYRFKLEYALAGGGSPSSPTLTAEQFGASFSATLTGSSVDYWVDSGQPWSMTNSISGSNPSERWYSFRTTNGTVWAALTANLTYYHQYELSCSYSISGGGSPAAPTVSYVSAGAPQTSPLTTSPSDYWVDSGQPWSMTNPLVGSNSTMRWMADNSSAAGTVSSSGPISVTYYQQVSVTVARSSSDGGSVSSSGGWYGVGASLTLTASPSPGWEFAGWDGTGTGSYTGTAGSASLTASSPITEVAEFYPGLTITASDGGSVRYSYASLSGSVAAGTSRTIYVQRGVSVALTSEPAFMYSFSGWSGALSGTGPQSISVSSPMSVQGSFAINMLYIIVIVAATLIVAFGAFVTFRRRRSVHVVAGPRP